MIKKPKVLFISQEIAPYLEDSSISKIGRHLPQGTQERGKEIRTFMPRFGVVNERRNQLHEVIRLSGMNLIIDDSDHPLIIKVASIQAARMQVYFIDNEEYFQRKHTIRDADNKFFKDNDDRTIFFCRGVLETVKKLGWAPDIIHCHGWMSSLIPLFVKTAYREDPIFKNARVVYSVYDDEFTEPFAENYSKKLMMDGISNADIKDLKNPCFDSITIAAINKADAIIKGAEKLSTKVENHIKKSGKMVLPYQPDESYVEAYNNFYDEIMEEIPVEA
ncbi:MAG TPA: glycogen/starch synthase [Bacteroidia bacterium]|nr:glycogen/starch synthase [Bacteroidia bacterium]HNR48697.1 glycogen/starch synthase [Bacteroidia bacterium]HNT81879.1 glycogen/starch synthase [Bacteroidia bacterium]